MSQATPQEEANIVNSLQQALAARRGNMCFSVYGHDAVDVNEDEWDLDEEDDSWMDF